MKQTTLALAVMTALALTACGESAEEKQARLFKEQQAQIQQLQAQQVQQAQIQQQQQFQQPQQYAPQPQVIQQPAAPVVVQAPHQDNTLMNMATGALIGHTIANMGNNNHDSYDRPPERVVERTIIRHESAPTTGPAVAPVAAAAPLAPTPAAPVAPKASAMDMGKLSESAKYAPPTSSTAPPAPRQSSMNMSALSSNASRPAVSLSKPSSGGMNMSRLSSAGKR
jgi:hypothetical protein